jgi:hypothetical protein
MNENNCLGVCAGRDMGILNARLCRNPDCLKNGFEALKWAKWRFFESNMATKSWIHVPKSDKLSRAEDLRYELTGEKIQHPHPQLWASICFQGTSHVAIVNYLGIDSQCLQILIK